MAHLIPTLTVCLVYPNQPPMLTIKGPSALRTPTTSRRILFVSPPDIFHVTPLLSSGVSSFLRRVAPVWVGLLYHYKIPMISKHGALVFNFQRLRSRLSLSSPTATSPSWPYVTPLRRHPPLHPLMHPHTRSYLLLIVVTHPDCPRASVLLPCHHPLGDAAPSQSLPLTIESLLTLRHHSCCLKIPHPLRPVYRPDTPSRTLLHISPSTIISLATHRLMGFRINLSTLSAMPSFAISTWIALPLPQLIVSQQTSKVHPLRSKMSLTWPR